MIRGYSRRREWKTRRKVISRKARGAIEPLEARRLLSVSQEDPTACISSYLSSAVDPSFALAAFKAGLGKGLGFKETGTADTSADGLASTSATQWLAILEPGASADRLSSIAGVENVYATDALSDTYVIEFAEPGGFDMATMDMASMDGVKSLVPLEARQQQPRFIPNDPLFGDEWHLRNTGQTGGTVGADVNIATAWDVALGTDVVIGIVDDGLQHTHPDLTANYLASASYDFNFNDPDPSPGSTDNHGTSVAGVAAGRGNNGIGVSGAAPEAQLAGLRLIAAATTDADEAAALSHMTSVIDIYSNSWGPFDDAQRLEGPGVLTQAAFADSVANGRGGLGNIYVWAAGNGLSSNDNVNYDGYANSRYTIAVSAIDDDGIQSYYSEPGAPILVAAYSSGSSAGITTTDLVGSSGYSSGDYTNTFGGTSSAAPLVSGIVALMLDANPNLSYRDVQHILVNTAEQNDPGDSDWVTNGGGHLVNHKYGFGAVDAAAAVNAAVGWTPVGPEVSSTTGTINVGAAIPDNNSTGVTDSVLVTDNLNVEWVEVVFDADHTYRGDLQLILTAPDGTESILSEGHGDPGDDFNNWTFTSARHWDSSSVGTWTLKVADVVGLDVGTWNSWQLNIYGTAVEGPPQIVLHTPNGTVNESVSSIDLHFSETMDTGSFSVASDVVSFTGPGGDLLAEITGSNWVNPSTLRVTFNPQTANGTYSLVLGPQILADDDGSPLDQDGDGTAGESIDDRYDADFSIFVESPTEIHGFKWNDLDGDGFWDGNELGLEDWTIFLDLNENGEFDDTTTMHDSTDVPVSITDNNTVTSDLTVSDLDTNITDVNVKLNINHTFDADLTVTLFSPSGTPILLFSNVGGGGDNFTNTTLDDEAVVPISSASAPFSGAFRPQGLLSGLDGEDPNGTWTLQVTDGASLDTGSLTAWSLEISVAEPTALTDATGAYAFTGLAGGTYVVGELLPEGWEQTYPEAGGGGAAADKTVVTLTTTGSTEPVYLAGVEMPPDDESGPSTRTNVSGPLINMDQFRNDPRFAGIDGSGYATVILDTGIDLDHPFFGPDADSNGVADRIVYSWDFADGDSDATDHHGHGSNVSSIVASSDSTYTGMAPGANIIHLKVFTDAGAGQFSYTEAALQWVVANAAAYNIVSVNMSLGDGGNYTSPTSLYGLGDELAALAAADVIVASASGNEYFDHGSAQGVAYPSADFNSLSIGAVWDANNGGPFNWTGGAIDNTTGTDRITSFSQRHATLTDTFAPGALIMGAGATGGTTNFAGTSQATPHITGIAVLAQQLAEQELGRRLTLSEFRGLLSTTGVTINDGDDENDNVVNTGLNFPRVDMLALAEGILDLGDGGDPGGDPVAAPGTHTVTISTGQIVTDINFGNRDLSQVDDLPQVIDVLVRGTDWTGGFLSALDAAGLGFDGYSVPVGSGAQLNPLTWSNVDQIRILFSEEVAITSDDLTVAGVNASEYVPISFSTDAGPDAGTFLATWTFAEPIHNDKLLLHLDDTIVDLTGHALDGEWDNPTDQLDASSDTYPSGDFDPGGEFDFRLNLLTSDASHNGIVDVGDFTLWGDGFGLPITTATAQIDFTGNNSIDIDDFTMWADNFNITLPVGEPSVAGVESESPLGGSSVGTFGNAGKFLSNDNEQDIAIVAYDVQRRRPGNIPRQEHVRDGLLADPHFDWFLHDFFKDLTDEESDEIHQSSSGPL